MRLAASPRAGNLLDWAHHYGERGWPVIPLVPRKKNPLVDHGVTEASANRHQIREWWTRWPWANIGLATGVGFDVLDIDGNLGEQSLAEHPDHDGPVSLTGRGKHRLYLPGGTSNRAGLLHKVDWRGTGGYIVAPPSVHPEGHLYAWHPELGPDTPLPPIPDWLLPMLTDYVEQAEVRIRTNEYGWSIVDIAEGLGYTPRRHGGGRFAVHCPFHEGDNEASLILYPVDNSFHCFGCGAHGGIPELKFEQPRRKDG